MRSNLEDTYKELLQNSDIKPPGELWDSISQNLDIDDVWNSISTDLDHQALVGFENAGIITSFAAVLIGVYLWSFPVINTVQDLGTQETEITSEVKEGITENLTERSDEVVETFEEKEPVLVTTTDLVSPDRSFVSGRGNTVLSEEQQDKWPDVSAQISIRKGIDNSLYTSRGPVLSPLTGQEITITDELGSIDFLDNDFIEHTQKRLFAGLTGTLKNTWIINNKTVSGLRSQELHTTKPIFGSEIGIMIGSGVSDDLELSLEYYPTSNYAQAYNEYVGGHYIKTSFNVDYHKFNFLLKYYTRSDNPIDRSASVIIGPYWGILKNASEALENQKNNLTDDYKSVIFGLTTGLEKKYQLNHSLDLVMGLRLSYGISNIYKGTVTIPSTFRITHPASIGLSAGLRYNTLGSKN